MTDLRAIAAGLAFLVVLAAVSACSENEPEARAAPATATPSASASPGLPQATHELSLPALMHEKFSPDRLRVGERIGRDAAYTRSRIRYTSGGLTITGVLVRPHGNGPFPGIVLEHGYVDPSKYRSEPSMLREQDRLARAGFVVLVTDYRGYGDSQKPADPLDEVSRIGYTRDVINAVLALQQESYVDRTRLALLGRSMGGGVALNALAVYPGLVRAAVIFSPVSSVFEENVDRFTTMSGPRAAKYAAAFGMPEQSPDFYAGLSVRNYFDRITTPILVHHGRADHTCPYRWSVATQLALAAAGVDSRLVGWDGEDHAFVAKWDESMDRSIAFLRERLDL